MLLYIIKIWTVRAGKMECVEGLCRRFTNLLYTEITSSERALYLTVHSVWEQKDKGRQWKKNSEKVYFQAFNIFVALG